MPSESVPSQNPIISEIGIPWHAGICIAPEHVGLRADCPFRFCTLHWGTEALPSVPFGDDSHPTYSRLVELYMPKREQATPILVHSHAFYELVLIRGGGVTHWLQGEGTALRRGDIILLAPGVSHSYDQIDRLVKTNIYLQPGWFFEDLRLLWWEEGLIRHLLAIALFNLPKEQCFLHMRATEEEMQHCERELDDMVREGRKQRPSLLAFHAGFLKILNTLDNAYKRNGEDHGVPLNGLVWKAADEMEMMIGQGTPLDITKLAQKNNVSKTQFTRVFTASAGMSPAEYYQNRRVQHAMRILLEPNRSLTEIAHHLGFSDLAHFSRVFKQTVGHSPSVYRKSQLA